MGCSCVKLQPPQPEQSSQQQTRQFTEENIRNNKENRFSIPNQNVNITSSQMLHYVLRYIWQGNFSSPVEELLESGNAKILNVKCGDGSWLNDNQSQYQTSNFFGCDVNVPSLNSSFVNSNVFDALRYYERNTFDFVYLQFGLYTEFEWREKVIKEIVRICKPGGWIEIMDRDNRFYDECEMAKQLGQAYRSYLESRQFNPLISSKYEELLNETKQISHINKKEKTCILGVKGDKAGKYLLQDIITTWQESKVLISESMGITETEYDKLIQKFTNEINRSKTYIKFVRVYGQKI